jgi:hypothetical protein
LWQLLSTAEVINAGFLCCVYQKCALPFNLSDSLHCEMEWAVPKCFFKTHFAYLAISAAAVQNKND